MDGILEADDATQVVNLPNLLPNLPGANLRNLPGANLRNLPGANLPNLPGTNLPNLPGANLPNLPGTNLRNFPGANLPNLTGTNLANLPGANLPNLPGTNLRNFPGANLPNLPGVNLANLQGANLANFLGVNLRNPPGANLANLLGVNLANFPGEQVVTNDFNTLGNDPAQAYVTHVLQGRNQNGSGETFQFDRSNPDYDLLGQGGLLLRVTSFHDWPAQMQEYAWKLADNGFFYTGYGDKVACSFCRPMVQMRALHLWQGLIERSHHCNPNCIFAVNLRAV